MTQIVPVILAGGGGSRLWPISTPVAPKQLLDLVSGRTLLQDTALRVAQETDARFAAPIIVTGAALARETMRQLGEAGIAPEAIILEPKGRNTAPAIAAAGRIVAEKMPGAVMAVLASDHHIALPDIFRAAILDGVDAAKDGALVTLGIVPTRPETGYGYIERGEGSGPCFAARRFVEKPDRATAEAYLADGNYF